jgi:hypothetical protein
LDLLLVMKNLHPHLLIIMKTQKTCIPTSRRYTKDSIPTYS